MGKKLLKKAGIALLAVMMSFALMPMKAVHAISYQFANIEVGDILKAGDTFNLSENNEQIQEVAYYKHNGGHIASGMNYNSGTYTVPSNVSTASYDQWEVTSITLYNNSTNRYFMTLKGIRSTAIVDDVIVKGGIGQNIQIEPTLVKIHTNVEINKAVGGTVSGWFKNLPAGLVAIIDSDDSENGIITLKIYGQATTAVSEAMEIVIPKEDIDGASKNLEVTSNSNAKFEIGEREATVENVAITGSVGETITNQTFKITIKNDEFVKNLSATSNLKTNLPSDLFVVYSRLIDETHVVVSVTGTPLASEKGTLQLTIPDEWLKSGEFLKVTANSNAKYDIGSVKITAGTNSSHKTGTTGDLKFTCSGKLDDFVGAYVDTVLVNPSHYTVQSGSTILTLKANYLNTLDSGTHTLKFQYKNNVSVTTTFKILADDSKKKPPVNQNDKTNNSKTPQTADMSPIAFYSLLVMVSGLAGVFVLKRKKEQI